MNKLIKRMFILTTVLLSAVVFLFSSEPAYAIKSIPDGGARIPASGGFMPEQNNVNSQVKKMWENRQIPRGGKDPGVYSPTRGNNLIYDVYSGTTGQEKKRGFYASGNYITFDGWALIQGHHHHAERNQATYIGLVNKNNPNDRLIFKAAMRDNTSANSETHDGQLPSCPSNAFNRPVVVGASGACNMDYQYTQFRAYIDLRDIFTGKHEGKEWEMYIIKRVEDQIVYDRLILPFDTESFNWKDGKVTMRSGEDARSLTMVGTDVIKRSSIGGSAPTGNQRYFIPGGVYKSNGVDDAPSNRVAVWYRVNDNLNRTIGGRVYEATYSNKWTASTFWEFGGSIATLKYTIDQVDVSVKHVDANNNSLITEDTITKRKIGSSYTASAKADGVLKDSNGNPYRVIGNKTQTKTVGRNTSFTFKYKAYAPVTINHVDDKTGATIHKETVERAVGENYSVSAKPKGHFKTKNGYDYVPTPANQRFNDIIRDKRTITFRYKASLPDPSKIEEIKDSTDGRAKGQFSWELHKTNENSKSRIDVKNNFEITGKHFATRKVSHKTSSSGVFSESGVAAHHLFVNNPNDLKNKDISYSFGYEFTNHYWENYKCTDKQGNDCFEWAFVNHTPAWERVKKAEWSKVLKADHSYGETFNFNPGSSNQLPLIISRVSSVNGGVNSMTDDVYRETFTVDRKDTKLDSQTWKEILETVQYQSGLNNGIYVIDGDRFYFPNDIDENLRSKYENKTSFGGYGKYAIPLRIGEKKRNEINFISQDNFFITKKTGFLFSAPYLETDMNRINILARDQYKAYTNKDYNDTILTSLSDGSRYYLNIDLEGEQKPNVKYDDNVVLGKLGLSDVTFHLIQKLEFGKYLFGHFKDEPVFVEQRTSVLKNINYANTISLSPEKITRLKEIEKSREGNIHSFRGTDDSEINEQVKRVVPLN